MNRFRSALLASCLVLFAGCGSDGDPVRVDDDPVVLHTLTPGAAAHGAMVPAAPVEVPGGPEGVAISAVADSGFVFAGWVATPADSAVFEDAGLASSRVFLNGDAVVAPTFMVATADYFVNGRLGADDAAGTSATVAFRTLTRALAAAGSGKDADPVIAVAPGHYDAAGGEVFPLVIPPGVTLVGDEENRGAGITVQGAGPLPSWEAIAVGVIPASGAAVRGLHLQGSGWYTIAYDLPSGGTGITLRRNTIAAGERGSLYVLTAAWGVIEDNVWLAGADFTLSALQGAGTTVVRDNVFHGPVYLQDNSLDLGGGAGASTGRNQFLGDGMSYFSGLGIMARDNRWKHAPPTQAPTYAAGPSDFDMYLSPGLPGTTIDTTGYW